MSYLLNSKSYTALEVTAKKKGGPFGCVKLYQEDSCIRDYYFKYNGFESCILKLDAYTTYTLIIENLEVSLMYLSGNPNVLDEGVAFLELEDAQLELIEKADMHKICNQSFRNQFHFSAYKNWINDPNGLCFFQGYYHMFYQYNPNAPVWGNMHWGHAISKDCIHWTHLPITFYPQIELLDNFDFRGGAFSGSALVKEDTMYLFFTRHYGKLDRAWQRQWQVLSSTTDGIHYTPEEPVIWGTPEGVFYDFRDPKVTYLNNCYRMVLGGTVHNKPSILHYTSKNLKDWEYKGILYQETNPDYQISECPDFFLLDNVYVLVAGYIYSSHISGSPRRDTRYYIGTFINDVFTVEQSGLLDYGKDFYAAQSFEHLGRRICIGWNCTAHEHYVHQKNSSNGTMSLPRQLKYENGFLHMTPIEECQELYEKVLFDTNSCKTFSICSLQEYQLIIKSATPLEGYVQLAYGDQCAAVLSISDDILSLDISTEDTCHFPVSNIYELEIYVDRSLIEVFINSGEKTCTRRYYLSDCAYEIQGLWNNSCHVTITTLKSIW